VVVRRACGPDRVDAAISDDNTTYGRSGGFAIGTYDVALKEVLGTKYRIVDGGIFVSDKFEPTKVDMIETCLKGLESRESRQRRDSHLLLKGITGLSFGYSPNFDEDARRLAIQRWSEWWSAAREEIAGVENARRQAMAREYFDGIVAKVRGDHSWRGEMKLGNTWTIPGAESTCVDLLLKDRELGAGCMQDVIALLMTRASR